MRALALLLCCAPGSEVVRDWLVVAPTDRAGRRPFAPSAVFARHLAAPGLAAPKEGDALTGELGEEQRWAPQSSGDDGSLGGKIGWAFARVESKDARVVLAKLSGASRLFVNGAGYVGDAYAYGFGGVPVALRAGANDVYVGGVRGSFRLELVDVAGPVVAGSWDHLVPDLVRGVSAPIPSIGVLAFNASDSAREIVIEGVESVAKTLDETYRDAQAVPPGAVWRFSIPVDVSAMTPEQTSRRVRVSLAAGGTRVEEGVDVPVREPGEVQRVGFTSAIDGSLQAYALLPQRAREVKLVLPVLLSLHGAGVDALGQARSYAPKDSISIVCPTNRRPYGFDWQDWGRTDAYEALDHFLESMRVRVLASFGTDPRETRDRSDDAVDTRRRAQIVLTGHSMGGHGTWSLAANDADAFDAIGPSAGWASFDSYGGRPDGALKPLWLGADFASRTEELATNLAPLPTFVLHGTADDNVPPTEARAMIALLESLGAKPKSHFQEGAGHWWDGDLSPGVDCVDHPGILALFDETEPPDAFAFDWTSADPGVDARHRWLEVLQPLVYGRPFRVRVKRGENRRELQLETDNVRCLRFARIPARLVASIDGHDVGPAWPVEQYWELTATGWGRRASRPRAKTPEQCGPFKRAFGNRFVLVYGTAGEPDEDRELLERARHDQQAWWYRANATARLVSDVDFLRDGFRGRNVIVYGNRDTNAAWPKLFGAGLPFDARRGELRLGERRWKGDDLGAVVVRPRDDDVVGLVGAFADTGVRGARLGYALAPFVSGVGIPDYALYSSAILTSGDGGVLAAGWFDASWKLDAQQYVKPD